MATSKDPGTFPVPPEHPLAQEHAAVAAWVDEASRTLSDSSFYSSPIDLKSTPAGKQLLEAPVEQLRKRVLAAFEQAHHWIELTDRSGWNPFGSAFKRYRLAVAVAGALMRRNLPFASADLQAILKWSCDAEGSHRLFLPVALITRALERFAAANSIDFELRAQMLQFAGGLRTARDKNTKRLGTTVEQLCAASKPDPQTAEPAEPERPVQPTPKPAPAGSPQVLDQLKRVLEMLPREPVPPSHAIEPDQFHLRDDSPLRHEHELLSSLYTSVIGKTGYPNPHLENLEAGRTFLELPPTDLGRVVLAAAERHVNALLTSVDLNQHAAWRSRLTAEGVGPKLLKRGFEVDREGTFDLLLYLSILPTHHRQGTEAVAGRLTAAAARYADESPLTEGERFVLSLYRNSLISGPPLGVDSDPVKFVSRLVNDGAEIFLVPGEVWTDGLNRDLAALDTSARDAWIALLRHCLTATAARPSAKWLKTAAKLIQAIGGEQLCGAISQW
ncbi:MAG TPA: hypothetical protein VHX68_17710, partial [Planctomycetaceae bacterium]|nr:hypothetical protein [Planctomycetaceae bacterium]